MCGLVGIAGKLETKDEVTMKRLLILDYFRGTDSTGLAAVRTSGDVKIAKAAVNPIDLFDMKRFTEALSGWNSSAFIGHNRAATKGKVNSNNAHPFQYDHIVGAHNGTLDQASWKKLDELSGVVTDVDSQAIFACIAKVGIEETVKHLQGAWALVWFNLADGTLNFLRNKERPFWYAYSKDFQKVLWASEHPMIRAATSLSASPYELFVTDQGHSYFQTEVDWWYRFPIEELRKGTERPKPRVKELKGKEPVRAVTTYTTGYTPFHGTPRTTGTSSTGSTSTTTGATGTTGSSPAKAVIELVGSKDAPFAGHLSRTKFHEMTGGKCSWCHSDVDFEAVGLTVNKTEGTILCPECSNNNTQNRLYLLPAQMAVVG